MDIQLPRHGRYHGAEAAQGGRDNERAYPVVAVTASAMTYNRQTMLAEGFDGYQSKPISVKDFLGELERVLASHES